MIDGNYAASVRLREAEDELRLITMQLRGLAHAATPGHLTDLAVRLDSILGVVATTGRTLARLPDFDTSASIFPSTAFQRAPSFSHSRPPTSGSLSVAADVTSSRAAMDVVSASPRLMTSGGAPPPPPPPPRAPPPRGK
jgi:hypothetical protein